ncbi:autophagy-related protein 13-like isoform X2 [Amphiura filiformis]|uniref:autophagy-related protein 13-like isoform X2 n=1 Tax=Amphiura filiformis TaxID=82378 RepID=UPI003B21D260
MLAKGLQEERMQYHPGASQLTDRERRDLNKFTKFLAFKSIQVIVQSRLGEKVDTQSKANTDGTDWFNLAIPDNQRIKAYAKQLLAKELPRVGHPLNIEVTLETAEGDRMVLESWSLGMTEKTDPDAKVHYAIYNRMGLLLKSLMCVSRVTPAYRIARHQLGSDYKVQHRVFFGEARLSTLGEDFVPLQIGSVTTPVGTLQLSVAYRTKLALSVRQAIHGTYMTTSPIAVRDDYYSSSNSPKRKISTGMLHIPGAAGHDESGGVDVYGSQDLCATSFSTSPPDPYISQSSLATTPTSTSRKTIIAEEKSKPASSSSINMSPTSGRLGAFASSSRTSLTDQNELLIPSDIPFMSLLQDIGSSITDSASDKPASTPPSSQGQASIDLPDGQSSSSQHSNKSNISQQSGIEDFVMVDFNPAFAKSDTNSDVVSFYRQFQAAPQLSMFDNQPTLEETLGTLPERLAKFEESRSEFDTFVESLQPEEESD